MRAPAGFELVRQFKVRIRKPRAWVCAVLALAVLNGSPACSCDNVPYYDLHFLSVYAPDSTPEEIRAVTELLRNIDRLDQGEDGRAALCDVGGADTFMLGSD